MFIHLLLFHFEKGVFDSLTKAVCGSSVKGSPRSFSPQTVKECFLKYTACCLFLQPLFPALAQYSGPGETSLSLSNLSLLLNPSSPCSSHDWPMGGRWGVEARNNNFLQKARYPKRWWASAVEYHLIRGRMPFSFIEQRRGGGEVIKSKMVMSLTKHLLAWPALGTGCVKWGCVYLFFPVATHRWAGSGCLPGRWTKALKFNIRRSGRVPRGRPLYVLIAADSILSVMRVPIATGSYG